jgi:hypothetical protein
MTDKNPREVLAAFIRSQARLTDKHPHKPGPGSVTLNNAEALMCAEALERYEFLRAGGPGSGLYVADSGRDWRCVEGQDLDERVDEARAR